MPAFGRTQEENPAFFINDDELRHVYAWLQSIARPTPTPVPTLATAYNTVALEQMVNQVDDMKVHSDFAKDATFLGFEGQKDRARQAAAAGRAAIPLAQQAINDIPDDQVRADLSNLINHINVVIGAADQAGATGDPGAFHGFASTMVFESRIYALPLALQALRHANVVGTVSGTITDQAGQPIFGALVTVSAGVTKIGAMTDRSGRFLISGAPAFRAVEVKGYKTDFIYHEEHVSVPRGGRGSVTIRLPAGADDSVRPVLHEASLTPEVGSGSQVITLRMRITDPQGPENLAEDQIFALNPDLGVAVILLHQGGDVFQSQYQLPGMAPGTTTWYFFGVDHQCNISQVQPLNYTVQ